MKLSMRHRILIGSSIVASLTFLTGVFINVGDSTNAVAGQKNEIKTEKSETKKNETPITVKPPYPNPFNESFHFDFISTAPVSGVLSIYDSEGQEIKTMEVQGAPGFNSIDVQNDCNMKPGIYYAILKSNNTKYVQRIKKN